MASAMMLTSSASAFAGKTVRPRTAVRAQAKPVVTSASATNGNWLPGSKKPAYLEGLAGNFGFDPAGLGDNKEALKWYVQAELVHGRWAMAAVAGILIPSILTKAGVLSVPEWYEAGKVAQDNSPIPYLSLLMTEIFLMGFVEIKRFVDFKKPQSQGEEGSFLGFEGALRGTGQNGYPGGIFDPLKLSQGTEASVEQYKWKELRNGRLAMLAFLGFCAQYVATGKGPLDNLADHVAHPWTANFTTNGVSIPGQLPLL